MRRTERRALAGALIFFLTLTPIHKTTVATLQLLVEGNKTVAVEDSGVRG